MKEKCIVAVDPRYFRPTEIETLLGGASKTRSSACLIVRVELDTNTLVPGIISPSGPPLILEDARH